MATHIQCDTCGWSRSVEAGHGGKKVRCPKCGGVVEIPSAEEEAPYGEADSPTAPQAGALENTEAAQHAEYAEDAVPSKRLRDKRRHRDDDEWVEDYGRGRRRRRRSDNGMAIASLVLGCVSIFIYFLGFITAPLGLIFGIIALRKLRDPDCEQGGYGMALAGVILNGLILLLWLVGIIVIVVFAMAARNAGPGGGGVFGGPFPVNKVPVEESMDLDRLRSGLSEYQRIEKQPPRSLSDLYKRGRGVVSDPNAFLKNDGAMPGAPFRSDYALVQPYDGLGPPLRLILVENPAGGIEASYMLQDGTQSAILFDSPAEAGRFYREATTAPGPVLRKCANSEGFAIRPPRGAAAGSGGRFGTGSGPEPSAVPFESFGD